MREVTMVEEFVGIIRTGRPLTWSSFVITILSGMIISYGGIPPYKDILVIAFAIPISIIAYVNSLNAYTDYEIDVISRPDRALPQGIISKKSVLSFSIFLLCCSVVLSFIFLPKLLFLFVLTGLALGAAYSIKPTRIKSKGIVANICISVGYLFLPMYGGYLWYRPILETSREFLITIFVLFVQTVGASISKDLQDIEGDKAHHMRTLPISMGVRESELIIIGSLLIPVIAFPLLTLLGILPRPLMLHLLLIAWLIFIRRKMNQKPNKRNYNLIYQHSFFFVQATILLTGISFLL
jgi:geranylgeranylglycerol-phosphate geranylgeranyltransferase